MPLHGALSPAFADLVGFQIHDVLFVLSHYDSFILAEDGQLDDRVLSGFLDLNLRTLPGVIQVESGDEALERIARMPDRFQLVIASPDLGDMDIGTFAHRLRHAGCETPVTLFGYDTRTVREYLTRHHGQDLEKPFVWQGDVGIFLAIVKQIEDRRNAPQDTGRLGVPAILLIEDSIRYYSSFLPVAYQAVFEQTRKLIPEGLSLTEKFDRIRRRPKILLCDRYEEAWDYFTAYRDQILGVISDVEFPRGGRPDPQAGERFVAAMRQVRPDIPAILHSRRPENEALARSVGADFLLKGSRDLLRQIRNLMRDRFHFGDFVFRMPDGTEVARAEALDSFERMLPEVPHEAILESARRNEISHWLMARGNSNSHAGCATSGSPTTDPETTSAATWRSASRSAARSGAARWWRTSRGKGSTPTRASSASAAGRWAARRAGWRSPTRCSPARESRSAIRTPSWRCRRRSSSPPASSTSSWRRTTSSRSPSRCRARRSFGSASTGGASPRRRGGTCAGFRKRCGIRWRSAPRACWKTRPTSHSPGCTRPCWSRTRKRPRGNVSTLWPGRSSRSTPRCSFPGSAASSTALPTARRKRRWR